MLEVPVQVPSIKADPEKANPKIGVGMISFSNDSRYMATRNGKVPILFSTIWFSSFGVCLQWPVVQSHHTPGLSKNSSNIYLKKELPFLKNTVQIYSTEKNLVNPKITAQICLF